MKQIIRIVILMAGLCLTIVELMNMDYTRLSTIWGLILAGILLIGIFSFVFLIKSESKKAQK